MSSRFFVDSVPRSLRAGLLAPLAGLVAAVTMFVVTLSVVAESEEARRTAPVRHEPSAAAAPAVTLAEAERSRQR